ncbi:hypothetical protein D3C85_1834230 [compost metagenome]
MKPNPVLVAVMYDGIGEEYMEFEISKESEIQGIIDDYNSTGEYKLSFTKVYTDHFYTAV